MQEQFDRRIGEFLRANSALRDRTKCKCKVDDPEQDHRVDLLGTLDDSALGVEPDQEISDDINELPLEVLDRLLFVLVQE